MKRIFTTTVLWACATLALAIANVPTVAGQEKGKAVVKMQPGMKIHESATGSSEVELRFDVNEFDYKESADSSITYSASGEKVTKYVYDLKEGTVTEYNRVNNAWEKTGSSRMMWLGSWSTGFTEQANGEWNFHYPAGRLLGYSFNYGTRDEWEGLVETVYDSRGNLTHFYRKYASDTDVTEIIYNTYGERDEPVLIKIYRLYSDGSVEDGYEYKFEYNASGRLTLFESYVWSSNRNSWIVVNRKEVHAYTPDGQLASSIDYKADATGNRWIESAKTERQYWEDGRESLLSEYVWHENRWVLTQYTVHYYPDPSGNIPVSAGGDTRVWSSGGQLYIAATANGAAQVYAVSGQLLKTVALTAGQTVAMPLPPGMYIVVTGGKTWKVIL
jgi:hypothetical protein